ncbi:E3 ubiquitin-protein ligase XIAP-like, partial [Mercenaria mercenaria]|uniref:E3 ubiquitin-protein ligase XIAP-like n=1 Tax=Mercenaria mercenaria TaxID=6596 RepID=UPI00234E794A
MANAKETSASSLIVMKPRFPMYRVLSERRYSFQSWPERHPIDKEDMIEAGLFYTGVGDVVGCYFCGGSLRQWEFNDIPMAEHARWYPECPHVKLHRGANYAHLIIRSKDSDENNENNLRKMQSKYPKDYWKYLNRIDAKKPVEMPTLES